MKGPPVRTLQEDILQRTETIAKSWRLVFHNPKAICQGLGFERACSILRRGRAREALESLREMSLIGKAGSQCNLG